MRESKNWKEKYDTVSLNFHNYKADVRDSARNSKKSADDSKLEARKYQEEASKLKNKLRQKTEELTKLKQKYGETERSESRESRSLTESRSKEKVNRNKTEKMAGLQIVGTINEKMAHE